ncbi:MAG TPA: hypothetical protein DCL61_22315 [Cyanobacteria bacterium UBA12227]|nr:hypothetical protein [Cyanobacteria bacterium UBA12227]HAX89491.1 hypothetical protein [Cyanobacteria bacterium UBA11370]HBY81627.1 hypothetical protein [Cyanobacteria bacterium UBA11148]
MDKNARYKENFYEDSLLKNHWQALLWNPRELLHRNNRAEMSNRSQIIQIQTHKLSRMNQPLKMGDNENTPEFDDLIGGNKHNYVTKSKTKKEKGVENKKIAFHSFPLPPSAKPIRETLLY